MALPKNIVRRVQQMARDKGMGRRPAPDPRDQRFPLRAVVPTPTDRHTRYWPMFADALDQADRPHCVAYAWMHMLLAAPTVHGAGGQVLGDTERFTRDLYARAQRLDEWDGEDYDGTSVRAGAKALQAEGRLSEYRWAWDIETVRRFVLERGVVIFGTAWYERMFVPDTDGYLVPEGALVGGHAYCLIGYSRRRAAFRVLNSWGEHWGQKGRAWLHQGDASALLRDAGEACSAIEIKPGRATATAEAVVADRAAAA